MENKNDMQNRGGMGCEKKKTDWIIRKRKGGEIEGKKREKVKRKLEGKWLEQMTV